LETLSYYLKNTPELAAKKIVVIVPIGEEQFQEHRDSYLKCIDYRHTFSLSEIKLHQFMDEIFVDDIKSYPHLTGQITSFLEELFNEGPVDKVMTMRLLKSILRSANTHFASKGESNIDWRMSIAVVAAIEIQKEKRREEKRWDDATRNHERNKPLHQIVLEQKGVLDLFACISLDEGRWLTHKAF